MKGRSSTAECRGARAVMVDDVGDAGLVLAGQRHFVGGAVE